MREGGRERESEEERERVRVSERGRAEGVREKGRGREVRWGGGKQGRREGREGCKESSTLYTHKGMPS